MWIPQAAALLLLGGASAHAHAAPTLLTPAQQADMQELKAIFLDLEDEYTDAYNAWRSEYSAASRAHREARAENPDAVFNGPERVEPTYFPRFDRLAQAGVGEAQVWCLSNFRGEGDKAAQKRDFTRRAMAIIMNADAPQAKLPRIVSSRTYARRGESFLSGAEASAILTMLETVSTDVEAQSGAAYALASMGAGPGVADDVAEANKLAAMRAVSERYPTTKSGKRAGGFVFQKERLQIGMVAPDIIGADVDGNPMKLSDFRGKATVIDFWGFW